MNVITELKIIEKKFALIKKIFLYLGMLKPKQMTTQEKIRKELLDIIDQAEYELADERNEGYVWNRIKNQLPSVIKDKDDFTDKLYNIAAKRVGGIKLM